MNTARHTDAEYTSFDPFQGDESDLKCRAVAIRIARKEHPCFALPGATPHVIKPGDRYRHERALVDGSFWGNYRICLGCLDKWIAECEGDDEDDAEGVAA